MSGLRWLLVLCSAPRGLSPGFPVSPSPQKSTFSNSHRSHAGPPCKPLSGVWNVLGKYQCLLYYYRGSSGFHCRPSSILCVRGWSGSPVKSAIYIYTLMIPHSCTNKISNKRECQCSSLSEQGPWKDERLGNQVEGHLLTYKMESPDII